VGSAEALEVDELVGDRPRWCGPAPDGPLDCLAQYRAHGEAVPARATLEGARLSVRFATPQRGVAPGQGVVLYVGDRVVGSATVDSTGRGSAPA